MDIDEAFKKHTTESRPGKKHKIQKDHVIPEEYRRKGRNTFDQEYRDNIVSGIEQLKLVLDYRANAKQNSYGKTQSKKYRESQSEIISITNIVTGKLIKIGRAHV